MAPNTLSRRNVLRIFGASGAAALLAACAGPGVPAAPLANPTPGQPPVPATAAAGSTSSSAAPATGQLRWAVISVPATLDPFVTDPNATVLLRALHTPLIDFTPDGQMVPNLASSWKAEGTTWTIQLRAGARFSDGSPVTADDMKASFDFWTDPANKYSGGAIILPYIKSLSVADAMTITLETAKPDATAIKRLFPFYVIPRQILSKGGLQSYAANPVGTGAYRFKSFSPNDSLVVEPNPFSWAPGKVATMTFQALPDEAARAQALKAGQVNLAARLTSDTAVPARNAGFSIQSFDSGQTIYLLLGFSNPNAPEILKDARVRRAVSMAIDPAAITRAVEGEYGKPAQQLARPQDLGYNPNLQPYPLDPDQAKQLFQQAGAQGVHLKLTGISNDIPLSGRIGLQAVAEALTGIGLDLELELLDIVVFITQFYNGMLSPLRVGALPDTTYDLGQPMINFQGGPTANAWYHTPEYDQLVAASDIELDPSKRTMLLQQMAQKLHDDIPAVPLAYEQAITGMDASVKNFRSGGTAVPDYTSLAAAA